MSHSRTNVYPRNGSRSRLEVACVESLELRECPNTTIRLVDCLQTENYPETGLEEIKGDLLQADFWPQVLVCAGGKFCPGCDARIGRRGDASLGAGLPPLWDLVPEYPFKRYQT